jgi:hypothetical protein
MGNRSIWMESSRDIWQLKIRKLKICLQGGREVLDPGSLSPVLGISFNPMTGSRGNAQPTVAILCIGGHDDDFELEPCPTTLQVVPSYVTQLPWSRCHPLLAPCNRRPRPASFIYMRKGGALFFLSFIFHFSLQRFWIRPSLRLLSPAFDFILPNRTRRGKAQVSQHRRPVRSEMEMPRDRDLLDG